MKIQNFCTCTIKLYNCHRHIYTHICKSYLFKLLALLFLCDGIVNNHEISYTSAGITKFSKVGLLKHESEINLKWSMSSYSSPSFCTCYAYSTVGQYTPSRVLPVPEPLWMGEQNKIHPDGFNRTISVLLQVTEIVIYSFLGNARRKLERWRKDWF